MCKQLPECVWGMYVGGGSVSQSYGVGWWAVLCVRKAGGVAVLKISQTDDVL